MFEKEKIVTNIFERAMLNILLLCISLLQLDANLIEGEPYNRFARKIKDDQKWREKTRQNERCRCWSQSGVADTQIFFHKILRAAALVTKSFLVLLMVESWRRVRESENGKELLGIS